MEFKIIVDKYPPSMKEIKDFLKKGDSGALFIFNGLVRDNNQGKEVEKLEYEIDKKTAINELKRFIEKYNSKVKKIFIFQAEGLLNIGDDTIIIGISSYSREESFKAVKEILEFMKHNIPVWKKEYYKKGSNKWL